MLSILIARHEIRYSLAWKLSRCVSRLAPRKSPIHRVSHILDPTRPLHCHEGSIPTARPTIGRPSGQAQETDRSQLAETRDDQAGAERRLGLRSRQTVGGDRNGSEWDLDGIGAACVHPTFVSFPLPRHRACRRGADF